MAETSQSAVNLNPVFAFRATDRVITGLGASYQWNERLGVDLAYAWIRILEADVTALENPAGTLHRTVGKTHSNLHNIAIQANYRF